MIVMKGNPYEVSCCICRKINGTLFRSKTLGKYVHMDCLKKRVDAFSSAAAAFGNEYDEIEKYKTAYNELKTSYKSFLGG